MTPEKRIEAIARSLIDRANELERAWEDLDHPTTRAKRSVSMEEEK